MSNPTLTDADRTLLAALEGDPASPDELAARVDRPAGELVERLDFMADNGLLRHVDAGYALTDDGRRLLRAPGDGSADDTIDAPEAVVAALRDAGLRADRLDAALGAFAFLQFWGEATAAEIADGAFSEEPLDFQSAHAWWTEFARDHLAALPDVDPPETPDGFWRYTGRPGVADVSDDGRKVVFGRSTDRPRRYASATEAMVEMGLSDDRRRAVAAALAALQRTDEATDETLRETAESVDGDAADGVSAAWLDSSFFETLERLPGVVRSGDRWRYTFGPDGYAST